CARGGGYFDLG
nr:immunoglobulin heavy chain junction region [Macaca mulatta]